MSEKMIKIYVEVPENWIDDQRSDDIGAFIRASKEIVVSKSIAKIVDKIVENTKLPKINITDKELKREVLNKMAERVLDKDEN